MPSHIHLIFAAENNNPGDLLRDYKTHTSKELQSAIKVNAGESRREWLVWMFERAGQKNSNVKNGQFWQQNNKPIELWSG
jgi:putative transposase